MDSPTGPPPGVYYSPLNNSSRQEDSWTPDSYFDIQTTDAYQHSSTQGSPQPLEDGPVPASDDSTTTNVTDAAHGYSGSFDISQLTVHPILGVPALLGHDGTVVRVYGPPLYHYIGPNNPTLPLFREECPREVVPQPPYKCGNTQKDWVAKPPIYFFTKDRLGVKLQNARDGTFEGVNDRDQSPFGADCRGITIRIHFPGYPSSTDVEKELKRPGETKAKSMQLSTRNYKVPAGPVIQSKVLQEVSKRIQWHIGDLRANSNLFPFNGGGAKPADEQWRLEQGRMVFERMVITALVNVSSGSWSPVICVE